MTMRRTHHHKKGSRKVSQLVNGKGVNLNMIQNEPGSAIDNNNQEPDFTMPKVDNFGSGGYIPPQPPPPKQPVEDLVLLYEPPYQQEEIDRMSCDQLEKAMADVQAQMALPFEGGADKKAVYQQVYDYMAERFNTSCAIKTIDEPPVKEEPTVEEEIPVIQPPYTNQEINSWDCATVTEKILEMENSMALIKFAPGGYEVYQGTLDYMKERQASVCSVPPPTKDAVDPVDPDPETETTTTPVDSTDPYKPPVILPFPILGVASARSGASGGGSGAPGSPVEEKKDSKWFTYFWIAVAAGTAISIMTAGKKNAITDLKP